MAVIYADGNYVIIDEEDGSEQVEIAKTDARYIEDDTTFSIYKIDKSIYNTTILFTEAASWEDDQGAAYTESTLRTFLRANTAS